jgi:acyl-[acyl-carrier-protein]-phospholipid O-acyltransferase/long-chain-fatty-acid--[acyl-carrier-protein] ligase
VDALPVLGTGKMDLRALKRIAMERLAAGAES